MLARRWWLMLIVLGAALAALPAAGTTVRRPQASPPPLLVKVHSGDTLWTIAREHGDPERDVREIIWHIRRANDVEPGRLQPGSSLAIPVGCLPDTGDAPR